MSSGILGAFAMVQGHVEAALGSVDSAPSASSAPLVAAWAFGALMGMRHAFEPDHLAAVATLVGEQRRGRSATWLGAFWGAGHTLALLVVGGLLFAFHAELPAWLARLFELVVAVMLVALGGLGVVRAVRATRARTAPHGLWGHGRKPLVVGLVHGLAGSGALMVLVVSEMPSLPSALVFMALFGLGSAATMAIVTGLVGRGFAGMANGTVLTKWLRGLTGASSVAIGVLWAWQSLSG